MLIQYLPRAPNPKMALLSSFSSAAYLCRCFFLVSWCVVISGEIEYSSLHDLKHSEKWKVAFIVNWALIGLSSTLVVL